MTRRANTQSATIASSRTTDLQAHGPTTARGSHFVVARSDVAPVGTWTFAGTRASRALAHQASVGGQKGSIRCHECSSASIDADRCTAGAVDADRRRDCSLRRIGQVCRMRATAVAHPTGYCEELRNANRTGAARWPRLAFPKMTTRMSVGEGRGLLTNLHKGSDASSVVRSKFLNLSSQGNVGFTAGRPHRVGHQESLITGGFAGACVVDGALPGYRWAQSARWPSCA